MSRSRHMAAVTIWLAAGCSLPAQQALERPAVFIRNQGQFDAAVAYRLTGPAGVVSLTAAGIVFGEGAAVFSGKFAGSNHTLALEADPLSSRPGGGVSRVAYKDVWPGISVRLSATSVGVGQEFFLQAGANPDRIAVAYEGIDSMTLDQHGSLVMATPLGTFRERVPQVYQEVGSHRTALQGRFKLTGLGTYSFQIDRYAPEYPLVIGPVQLAFSQSAEPGTAAPVINFFNVAPTSTLSGQAAIGTVSVSGATSATVNGVTTGCSNGECVGTILFDPTATTRYVLEASGAGGNVSASQTVEVGQYQKNPAPVPAGLQVTWQGACWLKGYPKSFCNGACQGMAFTVNVPTPPAQLPLEATLYLGTQTCNPAQQDNLNDDGTLTGSGGWIFWFSNHPNKENTSAIWTFGNQSSGCVSYAKAPDCE